MVAHHPKPDRAFTHGAIARPRHGIGRGINEGLQHIIQEAHHIGDELRLILPLKPGLKIERRQAAHRRALFPMLVNPGR